MTRFKNTLILTLILMGFSLIGQTSDQTRLFFNRTHVAISKVEKEMYKANNPEYEGDIKKAIKYQVIALNLYKQNNFKDAVGYSYKARVQCIEICTKMNIEEGKFYALNDNEKEYCNPNNYINLKAVSLDPVQSKKIDELNILDPAKFREITLIVTD